jgi:hypothetical protein
MPGSEEPSDTVLGLWLEDEAQEPLLGQPGEDAGEGGAAAGAPPMSPARLPQLTAPGSAGGLLLRAARDMESIDRWRRGRGWRLLTGREGCRSHSSASNPKMERVGLADIPNVRSFLEML